MTSKNPSAKANGFLELMVGIEPTTCSLRVNCSAIEPHQPVNDLYYINNILFRKVFFIFS